MQNDKYIRKYIKVHALFLAYFSDEILRQSENRMIPNNRAQISCVRDTKLFNFKIKGDAALFFTTILSYSRRLQVIKIMPESVRARRRYTLPSMGNHLFFQRQTFSLFGMVILQFRARQSINMMAPHYLFRDSPNYKLALSFAFMLFFKFVAR